MQSVKDFHAMLVDTGSSSRTADDVVSAMVTHASVCRRRADEPESALREFIAHACKMTRTSPRVHAFNDDGPECAEERRVACEALHDLIMEGV